jgi:death-on-curing protein
VALVFLKLNGVTVSSATGELYSAMIAIAERRMGKPELAGLLRSLGKLA